MHHDLIVFGEDWGGLPSSTQHLIKHLAQTRKIIWINSIGLRRPRLTRRDLNRLCAKLLPSKTANAQAIPLPYTSNNNFQILNPRTLPAPRSALGRWAAVQLLLAQIKPLLKLSHLHAPILWTSLPTAVDMIGKLNESAVVYYCGDDFSGLAGVDHHTVAQREQELHKKADLIIASSAPLAARSAASRTQLLTHGVDYSLFSTPAARAADLPNDGRNIAGFYGSISHWLDLELLQQTIKKMPDWHFVFIGKTVVDISVLTRFKNVTLLGERPHHQLPAYSQHWTAALLPFVDNAQIRACNPLKLSEYLAAGRPIISTSFPAVAEFQRAGIVQTADSSYAMVEALRASEHLCTLPAFTPLLRNQVRQHSWAARAAQVAAWLEKL
ncbi:MAG: glycosyltransferase involved in cell wall biosynthesis [Psychromonas sp.]|jgi:glycosyltransferase involved in cell wall biosynthesis|uniref:glycosyltransferase n=1 Tax=Psychromonas sp. TaxID=1884585 RepID=UPI0039E6FD27